MSRQTKIKKLIETSRRVILDCSLENGAIVAANSTKNYFPKETKNYFYVWPRDAAFTCIAADLLGLDIQEKFFDWLIERAEKWKETGLFYEKYYPNGLQALERFQPDQTGTILFAIYHHLKNTNKKITKNYKDLMIKSADGICNAWKKDHFDIMTNDLWEERYTFPDLKDNFTYSLAACIKGLECVNEFFPNEKYITTINEMKNLIMRNAKKKGYFFRSFGKLNDEKIDSSLLGLIWPFEIVKPSDPLAINTVSKIIEKLTKDYGVYRYENDEYDGWMYRRIHRNKGAGFWPLLNFWLAIVLNKIGKREEALKYYYKVINSIEEFIPEQIFGNNIQKSVSPLCWSHSMFIIATRELGFLKE